ncbi:hypothetical protein KFE25_010117 [Diacronema lutheri]|uniref:Uncharacterized protein n=1 Tax=Diacronema lutheri TaxID=2081491 RepID=A0A8J5XQA6_DIALT|nr:hypothetical protein KFE25_010117 [Diacronema lutheri]
MAEAVSAGGVERLLSHDGWHAVSSAGAALPAALCLQVTRLRRFLVDESFFASCGPTMLRPPSEDAFELTLSDGARMKRCVLSTELNHLVCRGELCALQLVRVDRFLHALDPNAEADLPPIVVVTELTPLAPAQPPVRTRADGCAPELLAEPRADNRPIAGVRLYFLHTECNRILLEPDVAVVRALGVPDAGGDGADEPDVSDADGEAEGDDCVDDEGMPVDAITRAALRAPSLARALTWHATHAADRAVRARKGEQSRQPALFGRVVRLCAPTHFGRADDFLARALNACLPVKLELSIADSSCPDGLNVVLWNALALGVGRSIRLGDALVLSGYRMKKRDVEASVTAAATSLRARDAADTHAAAGGGGWQWEVALNSRNPTGRARALCADAMRRCQLVLEPRLELGPAPPMLPAAAASALSARARARSHSADGDSAGEGVSTFGIVAHLSEPVRSATTLAEPPHPCASPTHAPPPAASGGPAEAKSFSLGAWLTLASPRTSAGGEGAHGQLLVWLDSHTHGATAFMLGGTASPELLGSVVALSEVQLVRWREDGPVAYARATPRTAVHVGAGLPDDGGVLHLNALSRDDPRVARALRDEHADGAAAIARAAGCPVPTAWLLERARPPDWAPSLAQLGALPWLAEPGERTLGRCALGALPRALSALHVRQQRTFVVHAYIHSLGVRPVGSEAGGDGDVASANVVELQLAPVSLSARPPTPVEPGMAASVAHGAGEAAAAARCVRVPLAGSADGARALADLRALFGLDDGDGAASGSAAASLESAVGAVAEVVVGRRGDCVLDVYREASTCTACALGRVFLARPAS